MPTPTLSTLPPPTLLQLSHLLQTQPHEANLAYSTRITASLPSLPPALKARSRLSNLFSISPHRADPRVQSRRLCLLHAPLSAALLHEIFTLIALEVGVNCNALIQHNTWLSASERGLVDRLRALHSLWLPAEVYEATFLAAPEEEEEERWSHQESGCEGCILTRIGADLEVVVGLRALLLSRRRTRKPVPGRPKVLAFVDGWVNGLVGDRRGEREREVLRGSEMVGEELKIVRKRIWRERREKRDGGEKKKKRHHHHHGEGRGKGVEEKEKEEEKEKQEAEAAIEQEGYGSDFEGEIVDHYAALRSTLAIPSVKASPARTPSLTTGSSAQTLSSRTELSEMPHAEMPRYPQPSSVYSMRQSEQAKTYEPPRRGKAWRGEASAGRQAAEYRDLLTPPEDSLPKPNPVEKKGERLTRSRTVHTARQPPPPPEPLERSRTVRRDDSKRHTRWSQFCE